MKKILIVDDHAVVRDGVKKIFDEQGSGTFFGEASTGPEALQIAQKEHWHVVVLDLSLGDSTGLDVLKELKQVRPKLPVLVLSMHSEAQYARRAFKAGAAGYITKDSSRTELLDAIHRVIEGRRYVSSEMAEKLVTDLNDGGFSSPHEILSDREFEVMCLIASGKTLGEIAQLLSISDKTVSTYRARILEKLKIRTSAEIVHYAFQNKLVG